MHAYLEMLQSRQLFAVELVLYVGHFQAAQYGSDFGARAQILVQFLQRSEILLGATLTDIEQLCVDLMQAFVVQLFAQDAKLTFQIGCGLFIVIVVLS